jgi:triosephosphate isomerase
MALVGAAGAGMRILYGGSVTSDNAHEILGLANVDGVLIGWARLLAADFDAVLQSYRTSRRVSWGSCLSSIHLLLP